MNTGKKWFTGHVNPWWKYEDFKFLNFTYNPRISNAEDEPKWVEQGYDYFKNLNGMIYGRKSPIPNYALRFLDIFDWKDQAFTHFKMNPGDALPPHKDTYTIYRRLFQVNDPNLIFRCIVFLENWKSGHYFEIDNHGITNWEAGDYVYWNFDVKHFAANIGDEPRYTLQITGHV